MAPSHEAPKRPPSKLPEEYAHFSRIEEIVQEALSIESFRFTESYEALWTAFCMQADTKTQADLISMLRDKSQREQDPDERLTRTREYWDALENVSTFKRYREARERMRAPGGELESQLQACDIALYHGPLAKNLAPMAESYPYIADQQLIAATFGDARKENDPMRHNTLNLFKQLKDAGLEDMLHYVTSIKLLTSARSLAREPLIKQLGTFQPGVYRWVNTEIVVPEILKKTERYFEMSVQMSKGVSQQEARLFGDDSLAPSIWRALVFLRSSLRTKRISSVSIRQPIIDALAAKDLERARLELEDAAAKHPGIIPQPYIDALRIEPSRLQALYEEEAQRPKTPAALSQAERLSDQQRIEPLVGKILSSPSGHVRGIIGLQETLVKGSLPAFTFKRLTGNREIAEVVGPSRGVFKPRSIIELIDMFDLTVETNAPREAGSESPDIASQAESMRPRDFDEKLLEMLREALDSGQSAADIATDPAFRSSVAGTSSFAAAAGGLSEKGRRQLLQGRIEMLLRDEILRRNWNKRS